MNTDTNQIDVAVAPKTKKTRKTRKTTGTATRRSTPKRVTVSLSGRVTREGEKVKLEKLMQEISPKTKSNIETIANKFGIEWKPTAYKNTIPKEVRHQPSLSFVLEGKTADNVPVFFDRYQSSVFVNGTRETTTNVMGMTKRQFKKMVSTK